MQPNRIGAVLRLWREKSNLGPIKVAAPVLGLSHATLGMYEREETLPDVDFLAVFAEKTGADFNELLKARLVSGKTKEARQLAETALLGPAHDLGKAAPSFQAMLARNEATLEDNASLIPITPEIELENNELLQIKKELEYIAGCHDATKQERAKADMMLRVAFTHTGAHERFQDTVKDYADKMRKAKDKVNQVCSEAGYRPTNLMMQVLQAMVYDDLIDRQLVMLVTALAQEQHSHIE